MVGTVGVPGERQFYLQVRQNDKLLSFPLEKSQAAALAERALELLKEAGESTSISEIDTEPLDTPIEPEFTIGIMSLSWQPLEKSIRFEAQALNDPMREQVFEELVEDDAEYAPPILRVILAPAQVSGFIKRTMQVVSAGRQPCIFCGGPVNPGGHLCPRANGHRRRE